MKVYATIPRKAPTPTPFPCHAPCSCQFASPLFPTQPCISRYLPYISVNHYISQCIPCVCLCKPAFATVTVWVSTLIPSPAYLHSATPQYQIFPICHSMPLTVGLVNIGGWVGFNIRGVTCHTTQPCALCLGPSAAHLPLVC